MSDPDQEEMRRKRLARLSQQPSPAGQLVSPEKSPVAGAAPQLKTPDTEKVKPPALKTPDNEKENSPEAMEVTKVKSSNLKGGASQLSLDFDSGIENMEVDERKESPVKRNRTTSSANYEATEEQVRTVIQNVLNIGVPGSDPTTPSPSLSSPGTREMVESGEVTGEADLISLLLLESLTQLSTALSPEQVVKYLVSCYNRTYQEESSYGRKASVAPLSDILQSCRFQITSSLCLVLQGAWSGSPSPPPPSPTFSPLYGSLAGGEVPATLLLHLVETLSAGPGGHDRLAQVFSPLIQHIIGEMRRGRIVDSKYSQPLHILTQLVDIRITDGSRPLCDLLVEQPQWLPPTLHRDSAGIEVAALSALGPFLAPSVFPEEDPGVADKYFGGDLARLSATEVKSASRDLQQELELLRAGLHRLFHSLVANVPTREATVTLLTGLLGLNYRRQQMQSNERMNAGDGFMLNLMSLLQLLAAKVRMDKVDPQYLHLPDVQVCRKDEARLKATLDEAEEYVTAQQKELEKGTSKKPNFPTQCWFLTLEAHHVGILPIIRRYQRRLRHLRELQKMVDDLEKSEPAWRNHPSAARNKAALTKWKDQIRRQTRSKACSDVGLLDETLFVRCLSFFSSAAEHMLRLLDPVTPTQPRLPFTEEPNKLFKLLPEWIVDDMADFLLFGLQYLPQVVSVNLDNTFLTWLLTMLSNPQLFCNPYLVSKLVEVLFIVNPAVQEKTTHVYARIMSHPICVDFLPSALMLFYTDVEQTGSSNEFYDKFTIRYHISIIIKSMWESPIHRSAIIKESNNGKQFIRFINMMMNDTTFLLDESLSALTRIHEVQEDMEDPAKWAAQSQETQTSRHRQLSQDERQCRSYLTLARETVDMFHYITQGVQDPFLRPELADRLAAMLDAVLEQLTNGPKCRNLKVKNPEKFGWEPKWLLSHLIDIYLHLDSDKLAQAIANDERSFKIETFQEAARRMETTLNKAASDVEKFRSLADRANRLVIQKMKEEEEWENVPDEFEDAIMGEIMEDPVILPGSGKICDRKHIIRHLLSTPNDPFNRQPLTEDKLIPATDLREKIIQWKQEQKAAKHNK